MVELTALQQILATVGIGGFVIIIIGLAVLVVLRVLEKFANVKIQEAETDSKRDNAITDLVLDSNTERKERQTVIDDLQKSNNHLQAEVFKIQIAQAQEAGRREEMRITNDKNEAKIVTLEIRIQELERHREQSNLRISELESQIAELEKKLATANVEIDILEAQKRELEAQLERERNRADTLNSLVTQIRAVDNTPTASGNTQAIPDMQDVDETIHPLPAHDETTPPDAEKPAA
jgi:chromosome segregation ATPase